MTEIIATFKMNGIAPDMEKETIQDILTLIAELNKLDLVMWGTI